MKERTGLTGIDSGDLDILSREDNVDYKVVLGISDEAQLQEQVSSSMGCGHARTQSSVGSSLREL